MSVFKKILFVDDDPITITIYKRMMEISSFCEEVITCTNGQEAKDYLVLNLYELPNVIFLDINMHVMDGWHFLQWFENWSVDHAINDLPIYVLTSSLSVDDSEKSKKYKSVKGFISKPISKEILNKIAAKK